MGLSEAAPEPLSQKVLKAGIKKERMSSTTSTDDAVSTVPLSSLSLNTITEEESKKITESQKDLKKEGGEVKTGGCEHCHKPNPTKRCSKRHPKCMKFMFCNEVCEKSSAKKSIKKRKLFLLLQPIKQVTMKTSSSLQQRRTRKRQRLIQQLRRPPRPRKRQPRKPRRLATVEQQESQESSGGHDGKIRW